MGKKEAVVGGLLLIMGFASGWFAHSTFSPEATVASQPADIQKPDPGQVLSSASSEIEGRLVKQETDEAIDAEQNKTEQPYKNSISSFAELLHLLKNGTQRDVLANFSAIRGLFNDEEFTEQLLENYLLNDDPQTKDRLRMIVKNAMWMDQKHSVMESKILDKMKAGSDLSEWLGLLSGIGVSEESSVDFISGQIPQLYEDQDIAAAIAAVSMNPFWMGSQIERQLREKVRDQISNYTDSTSPEMRKAVLTSLNHYPRDNAESLLLNAMDDLSNDIRETAFQAVVNNGIFSESLKTKLLQNMQDQGQPWEIRELSYIALRRYKLENENYDALRDFSKRIEERYLADSN